MLKVAPDQADVHPMLTRTHIPYARSERERGIGLVEVLIVIVIVAVLMTVSIGALRGAKKSGSTSRALGAATAYSDAIEQFATDARGQYPLKVGSANWPNAKQGPVSTLARGNGRYLRTIPAEVQSGVIGIGAPGSDGYLKYAPSPVGSAAPTGFELQVIDRNNVYQCSVSKNVTRAGLKPCTSS